MMYGPQAALIAECFSPRLRYSGSSLGYHLASVVAGGPAPMIATALLAATGSGYAVAMYIVVCAVVSVVATSDAAGSHRSGHSQEAASDSLADPAVKARWRADPAGERDMGVASFDTSEFAPPLLVYAAGIPSAIAVRRGRQCYYHCNRLVERLR